MRADVTTGTAAVLVAEADEHLAAYRFHLAVARYRDAVAPDPLLPPRAGADRPGR